MDLVKNRHVERLHPRQWLGAARSLRYSAEIIIGRCSDAGQATSHHARFYRGGARRQNRTASSLKGPLRYGKALRRTRRPTQNLNQSSTNDSRCRWITPSSGMNQPGQTSCRRHADSAAIAHFARGLALAPARDRPRTRRTLTQIRRQCVGFRRLSVACAHCS
jgi:hypothetical protein